MVMEMMKHWESAADGIQILLGLVIIFFLIRNRGRKMKPDMANPKSKSAQNFNLQVFSQAIDQQVELAFTNIREVVATERRNLEKVLQFHSFNHAVHSASEIRSLLPPAGRDDNFQHVLETAGPGERQSRIETLATRGMSAKQISEKLKIAMAEVELILSLQGSREN